MKNKIARELKAKPIHTAFNDISIFTMPISRCGIFITFVHKMSCITETIHHCRAM